MKKKFKIALIALLILAGIAASVFYLCSSDTVVLNPKGMIGMKQRTLLIHATLLMLIVVIPVVIFTLFFAWKYRESNKNATYKPDWSHDHLLEVLWWGIPCIIIIILAIITWKSSHELNPYKPIETDKKALTIQVVALDWKWLFIYPEQGIASVNFVQFPVETPINFEITSDAPMNSFWIPQLGGQIYAMSAMTTKLHLIADEAGDYRGCSANISGAGFAGMKFIARASSQEAFDQWVQSVKQSPKQLNRAEYNELLKPSEYHPVTSYVLTDGDLFEWIVMKYNMPAK